MSMRINSILSIIIALVCAQSAFAQPKDNSPYSRMGLGDLSSLAYTANLGSGGFTAAYNDPYQTNALNPASLGYLMATSYEFGFNAEFASANQNDLSSRAWSGNLKTISLAFPVFNPISNLQERKERKFKWAMQFGLSPFSTVGYDIESLESDPDLGTVRNTFRGEGGLYQLNIGNGFKYNNIALGFSVNRLIGNIENSRIIDAPSLLNSYVVNYIDDYSMRSWSLTGGMQYTLNFKKTDDKGDEVNKGDKIVFGAYGNLGSNLDFKASQLYYTRNIFYPQIAIDTLLYTENAELTSNLPASYTVGIAYHKSNKLRIGIDYSQSFWSEFENPLRDEQLVDANKLNAGVEFIPNSKSYNSYAKRIHYRAGFFYENDYRVVNTNLRNVGISIGAGFPIRLPRQQVSAVNLSLELGQFGSPDLIMEKYAKINIGFTLNDNLWFFKRKFY